MPQATILGNIGQLVSMAQLARGSWPRHLTEEHLGCAAGAWLALQDGKVVGLGTGAAPAGDDYIDCQGRLALPGLIDAHTHLLFAGARFKEFAMRSEGWGYQRIAEAGGGIAASLRASRQASDEQLLDGANSRLAAMNALGVTALEVKSGYGLGLEHELRHLGLYRRLQSQVPMALSITALPLHAVPPEASSQSEYVREMTDSLLPQLPAAGGIESVDAFVEKGYFSVEEAKVFFLKAKTLGLEVRVHADELSRSGGAALAADVKACSADHLQFASREDAEALAAAGVVAVLLPGTSLYTKLPFTDGRLFREAGCKVAVATDFNPGSCYISNLPLIMGVAAVQSGLSAAEALAAVTVGAAASVPSFRDKGHLEVGSDADLAIFPFKDWREFVADFGQTRADRVWAGGKEVKWGRERQS